MTTGVEDAQRSLVPVTGRDGKKSLDWGRAIRLHIVFLSCVMLLGAAAARADEQPTLELDIPAGELAVALDILASQSGLELVYRPDQVKGISTEGIKGKLTIREAVERLLKGTSLQLNVSASGAMFIAAPRSSGTSADSVGGSESPIRLAQESPPPAAQPAQSDGVISGQVTDATESGVLPGALLRIVETGQETRSDDLGKFEFRGLTPGTYTLSVSYLGYADKQWRVQPDPSGAAKTAYSLDQASGDLSEITIFGNRSARAIALNQQRTAQNNSEVVSADLLGNFTGTTISEALRRVSGVAFQRDPYTGSGTNIIIRGLEPDMNAVKLNGLNLPVGDGISRAANLNNILADSVSKITIHKTLLPSHDSSGTGGLVEIETKSPLERADRYFNLAVEGGRRGKNFGDDYLVSGTASRKFGDERNLGLSASAQYTEGSQQNSNFDTMLQFGEYLPLSPVGTPTFNISDFDPRLDFPYEAGASRVLPYGTNLSFIHSESSTLALTLSGEWQPTSNSSLRLDAQHSQSRSSTFNARSTVQFSSYYLPRGVAALDGEVRQALTFDGTASINQLYNISDGQSTTTDTYSLRGNSSFGRWKFDYDAGFAHGADQSPLSQSLNLGFLATQGFQENFEARDFLPEATDPVEGIILTPFRPLSGSSVALPLLSPSGLARVNDADRYYLQGANISAYKGRNDRYTANFDARYDFGGRNLKYLQAGVSFENSKFDWLDPGGTSFQVVYTPVPVPGSPFPMYVGPSLAPLGMRFVPTDLSRIGRSGQGFNYLGEGGVRSFFDGIGEHVDDPNLFASVDRRLPTALERAARTEEKDLAAFVQAQLDFGKLEVIGGVRLSHVEVRAISVSSPHLYVNFTEDLAFARRFARLLDESATQVDILPRIALNFRQTDNLIFRGGYFLTTARPEILQLSSAQTISFSADPIYGPDGNQAELSVGSGNPELKPAITHNFDADVEYYHDDIGVIRLGGFYKRIVNFLQYTDLKNVQDLSGIELPDDERFANITPQNTYISVTKPENNGRAASLWGAELHVERQFTFLPGLLKGFGMFANYAYTHSKSSLYVPWNKPYELDADGNILSYRQRTLRVPGRFYSQPETSGTVALTYNLRGIDATLAYGFQDRYQSIFAVNNLDTFSEGVHTLDLRVAYFFDWGGMKWRTFFEGTDLLKGPSDPDLLVSLGGAGGVDKYYTGGSYLGGREFRAGFSATF